MSMVRSPVHREALTGAVWIAIPVLIAVTQFIRGVPIDGVILLAVAGALTLDLLGVLPPMSSLRRLRWSLPLVAVLAIAGMVLVIAPRHGPLDALDLSVLGIAALPFVWPDYPARSQPAATDQQVPRRRSAALWAGVGIGAGLWELASFVLGLPGGQAATDHPAISDVLDPAINGLLGRTAFVALWLVGGVALLRRGRRS